MLGSQSLSRQSAVGLHETTQPPLEARQLSRVLQGRPILDRIDLTIAAGKIVALTGINGAGKTTLLRCLAGRLRPSAGDVLWYGNSPTRRPDLNRLVGFAGHESFLYLELTAMENLLFAARMHGLSDPQITVNQMLAKACLDKHAHEPAGHFSKGMCQRLSLARALVHGPTLVILDEPFSTLDAPGRQWLEVWLKDLRTAGRAIIFTTHEAEQAQRIADETLDLRGGRLLPVSNRIAASQRRAA